MLIAAKKSFKRTTKIKTVNIMQSEQLADAIPLFWLFLMFGLKLLFITIILYKLDSSPDVHFLKDSSQLEKILIQTRSPNYKKFGLDLQSSNQIKISS